MKLNFPELQGPEQMVISCALDVADMGGMHLHDLAPLVNVTRERIRQIEITALAKLEASGLLEEVKA